MPDELVTPNLRWAAKVSRDSGVPTRCPYAAVGKCPRYYESVSLLGEQGIATRLPENQDAELLAFWRKSELWPAVDEQAATVSDTPEKRSFTNFCPEVAYDFFGFFASSLFPYHDETDLEAGLRFWSRRPVQPDHWCSSWSSVTPLHYTDCRLYAMLERTGGTVMPDGQSKELDVGLVRKVAVLCKDYYTNRTIDDLFIFAGADPSARQEPNQGHGSERMDRVYGWIDGLQASTADRASEILLGVASQIADNEEVPADDRSFLRRRGAGQAVFGKPSAPTALKPSTVEELLERIVKGLPRAIHPLRHRRKGATSLGFANEYDVQSLFHALIAPWVRDIRPEEYTPSYAGSSTRVDFLLAEYELVVELKYVRDRAHARKVGDELIIDIAHYASHPKCRKLWAVIHDPNGLVQNPDGLIADLEGERADNRGKLSVRLWVLQP